MVASDLDRTQSSTHRGADRGTGDGMFCDIQIRAIADPCGRNEHVAGV